MRIFRRRNFESDRDAERRFHMSAYVDDLIRSGLSEAEAERRAQIEFRAPEATKDKCRQAWALQRVDEMRADIRLTLRTLRSNPGFAAIAIVSLALGIGANTAIFGLIDTVMLRELPVRDPAGLVFVRTAGTEGRNGDGPPYPCFELLRDHARSFAAMAAFSPSNIEVIIDTGREQTRGVWVSGNFYEMLGVSPLMGRTLSAADDQTPGKGGRDGAVAVISRAYWQHRFAADPAVVGRTIRIFDHTVTIVGVMPLEGMSPEPGYPADVAVPMMLSDPAKMRDHSSLWLEVIARLKPGVRAEQARAESNVLFQAYMADVSVPPEVHRMLFDHMELRPAARGMGGLRTMFSQPLTAMMILAGLVLLAACVNVANLMLARATARQKEFAVRMAIGAGRGRLVRQTLTEALVLVGAGAALGIWLAREGERALAAAFTDGNNIVLDLALNGRMLLFSLAVAIVTGFVLGIVPALRAAQADPAARLQTGSRGIAGSRASVRFGRGLVIVQVALSTVLLAAAGLFVRSLRQLESVDPGFIREGILMMEVAPERQEAGTPRWLASEAEMLERVRRMPGVRSASWATFNPLSGRNRGAVLDIPGFAPRSESDKNVHLAALSPDYFDTFGVPLLLGRTFTPLDSAAAPNVAILNDAAARFYFAGASPIGKRVRFANYSGPRLIYEIIGVVWNAKQDDLREQPERFIYVPIPQSPDRINRLSLAVRCTGDPVAFAPPVRREIQAVRSTVLISNISTMEKQIQQSLSRERLVTALSTAFGALAAVLTCIGLYGILAYSVTRRTNEIGIRMALGATSTGMIWLVLREALILVGSGIVIGLPAVLLLARVIRSLLYGVHSFDLPALACAVLLLLVFAVIAAIVPARRASMLDAMSALRCE